AVPAVPGQDPVAGLPGDRADGVADVADPVARHGGRDAGGQRSFGRGDQVLVRRLPGPDGEADGRVAAPAVEVGAAVDADEVAVAQPVVGRDAVHDGVVDTGTDHAGVRRVR